MAMAKAIRIIRHDMCCRRNRRRSYPLRAPEMAMRPAWAGVCTHCHRLAREGLLPVVVLLQKHYCKQCSTAQYCPLSLNPLAVVLRPPPTPHPLRPHGDEAG